VIFGVNCFLRKFLIHRSYPKPPDTLNTTGPCRVVPPENQYTQVTLGGHLKLTFFTSPPILARYPREFDTLKIEACSVPTPEVLNTWRLPWEIPLDTRWLP